VLTGPGIEVPVTPAALWCWLRGDDRGELVHRGRSLAAMFGRRRDDNEEIADAPPSAHVKRTAQESFEPEAFVLRRLSAIGV